MRTVIRPDISTVIIIMVFSTVWISITAKPKPRGKGKEPKPLPMKSVFGMRHYSLKKRQKCKPICTICKKGIRLLTEQAEHWKHRHADKDEYKCKQCGKEFSLASNYKKKHVLLHQEEKKKIVYEECGQRFSYPSQLKSHLEVHSPCKIHKCPSRSCGKVFKYSDTLKMASRKTQTIAHM